MVTICLNDSVDSGRHRVGESLEILCVLGKLPPGLLDDLSQLLQVGGSRVGGDDLLQASPEILIAVAK